MVFLRVRIIDFGVETAEQLVREILSRNLRNRKAVARYAELTRSPDENRARRREKGLTRSGNRHVRSILIQRLRGALMVKVSSAADRDRRLKDRPTIVVVEHECAIGLRRDITQVRVHFGVGRPPGHLDDGVNVIPTEVCFIR
jgi:transposase